MTAAKTAKNDEFYTQYDDIEKEINAYLEYNPDVFRGKTVLCPCDDPEWSNFTSYFRHNFRKLGLKRLISSCISQDSRAGLFGDPAKLHGRYLDMTAEAEEQGELACDGDFRSPELCRLRDAADMVVTNPPFSLFREFVAWLMDGGKQFLIIGNMNAITFKGVFPLIKENRVWLGATGVVADMVFAVPEGTHIKERDRLKAARMGYVGNYTRLGNSCWFTNIEHGRRHKPLVLMTMEENKRYSRHKEVRGHDYARYDNYNAIEVPYVDAIPSDYDGIMGVPISFLDKYCPEQFEIVGCSNDCGRPVGWDKSIDMTGTIKGKSIYKRLLIRHRRKQ